MIKIYKITNKLNNKCYIGLTKNALKERWYYHIQKSSECPYIKNSIQKYGEDNFIIEQIDFANNIEEANEKEYYWIKTLNTLAPNGYNLREGGKYGAISEVSKEKNRQSQYKRWAKKEEKQRQSNVMKVRWKTEKDTLLKGVKEYVKNKRKKLIGYNPKTNEILKFDTVNDAIKNGYSPYNKTSKGFYFFKDEGQSIEDIKKLILK